MIPPQDHPDTSVPKQEAGADAKEGSALKSDKGAPTTPVSPVSLAQQEVKEERDSPREDSEFAVPLIDVLHEPRIVQHECRQLSRLLSY